MSIFHRLAVQLSDTCFPWTRSRDPQLRTLRQLDPECEVFGAEKHRYRAHRVAEAELAAFETRLGLRLPEGYRRHLLEVGTGAGPYYGLWSLKRIREELALIEQDWNEVDGPRPSLTRPFPLTRADASRVLTRIEANDEDPYCHCPDGVDGCLPICSQGCTYSTVLIVTGPDAGCVWDVDSFGYLESAWMPARRAAGLVTCPPPPSRFLPELPTLPTFDEWYQAWAESITADLAE